MEAPAGEYAIGPANGRIALHTTREGMAAKVGHDLLIGFREWSGTVSIPAADLANAQVHVEIDLRSLHVLAGTGGVAPLSSADRTDIEKIASKLLDARRQPMARFRSSRASVTAEHTGSLVGSLSLRGREVPVTLAVTALDDGTWQAEARVLQTSFGIPPYKALFGALRLADPISIEVTLGRFGGQSDVSW